MTLLRTGDFLRLDAVAESFMRSSVVRDNDAPIRCAKHLFGSGFSGAVLFMASIGIEDEDGAVLRRISAGLADSVRWSNRSAHGSASSVAIRSRIACHGGSPPAFTL